MNIYLNSIDRYIKEELKAKYYVRYMDDMLILGSDKKRLGEIKNQVSGRLGEIGLSLNGRTSIAPVDGGNGLNDEGTAEAMSTIRQGVEKFRRELE